MTTANEAIPRAGVVDLTSKLAADGRLRGEVPAGDWIILRLGHTPVGWPDELAWGSQLTGRKVAEALVLFPRPSPADKAPAKS